MSDALGIAVLFAGPGLEEKAQERPSPRLRRTPCPSCQTQSFSGQQGRSKGDENRAFFTSPPPTMKAS